MAVTATGVFTVAGASLGGPTVSLSNDPFGVALAQRFAGMTASYVSSASGVLSYPTGSTVMTVGANQGIASIDGPAASSALLVSDGTALDYVGQGDATIVSGNENDTVTAGSGSSDTIAAGSGNNVIDVSAAANAYVDSFGSDQVTAGDGQDTVMVEGVGTQTTINGGGAGSGSLIVDDLGSTGTAVNLASGGVRYIGEGGSAAISGGADTIYGASGAVVTLTTSSHDNVLVANDQRVVEGGSVVLDGHAASGGNQFWAGSGNTTLIGGIGADTLVAGMGAATLTGGSGAANMFAFFTVQGGSAVEATISDFTAASGNAIVLFGYGPSGVADAMSSAAQVGSDTQMTLSDGTRIVLANFEKSELSTSDFRSTPPSTS